MGALVAELEPGESGAAKDRPPWHAFAVGNEAAVTHGARSERRVLAASTNQKRSFLRRIGLRQAQLDPVGLALLDNWSRSQAKVVMMDAWVEQHGWVDEAGNLPGFAATYFAALNSARLSLTRLAVRIDEQGLVGNDPVERLNDYLVDTYGDRAGNDG
jgi:hypothetical protein